MKIHRYTSIPHAPSSFTIANARMLPNAETTRWWLPERHSVLSLASFFSKVSTPLKFRKRKLENGIREGQTHRFCTWYLTYPQLSKYIQHDKNPASNAPINALHTTITFQSLAHPYPTLHFTSWKLRQRVGVKVRCVRGREWKAARRGNRWRRRGGRGSSDCRCWNAGLCPCLLRARWIAVVV